MSPPNVAERVASLLALLCEKIRRRSYTELEVQETLGWERSHFKQLKTGHKGLCLAWTERRPVRVQATAWRPNGGRSVSWQMPRG